MHIGYVQSSPSFGSKERNFEEIERLVEPRLSDGTIDLLVLPELFSTGYAFASRQEAVSLAEPADGPTASFLMRLAEKTGGFVVAGFAERDGEKIYNSSLIVDSGRTLGTYRKIHLFNKETLFFDRAGSPPPVFEVGEFRFGVMICFDWIFPETMRILMLGGADIVAHPSNLVLPYCQAAMKTRCLENRMFAVTSNRIGTETRGEDDFTFTGASQITAVDGRVLSSAPTDSTHVDTVEIDPKLARTKNINPYNNVATDRRTELYARLVSG